jgi:predicted small lipoprotein YifL
MQAGQRRYFRRIVVLALLVAAASSCGRKGDPMPPVIRRADRTRDLQVYQEGIEAVLRWSYPSSTTAGGPLPDIEAIEVWRTTLPAAQEPTIGTTAKESRMQAQLIKNHGELLLTLDRDAREQATRGPYLEIRDDLSAWYEQNKELMPLVIWYSIRTICCNQRPSEQSNVGRLAPQIPPEPPVEMSLEANIRGIEITWPAAEGLAAMVERSSDRQDWLSVTARPVADGRHVDSSAGQGKRWYYRVRSVRVLSDDSLVVGDPGPVMGVDYPDVYPPEPPENLVCLPEGDLVRLRWDEVANVDFYRIFRQREGGNWQQLSRQQTVGFEDKSPPIGNLTYAVKSVDSAGNDSEAATCTTVMGF